MRPIWSGSISFGLVNIPIRLYTASDDKSLSFNYLHKKDLSPVRYAKVCREEEIELSQDDLVRGYQYEKNEYVVLSEEDFEKANVRKRRTIDLTDFVSADEVDSMFMEKPYYLEPEGGRGADKPYAVLREALKDSGRVGIGTFVMKNREQLVMIKPSGDVLEMIHLRFAQEIRPAADLDLPKADGQSREMELAKTLIDHMSGKFNPESYRDTYTDDLKRVIDEKIQGREVVAKGEPPKETKVTDLMAALKASLETAGEKPPEKGKKKEKAA